MREVIRDQVPGIGDRGSGNGAQGERSADSPLTPDASPIPYDAVIAVPLADVRREPDAASELVTQALLGIPAVRLAADPSGTWIRVRLPDYEGWVPADALVARPGEPAATTVQVTAPAASLTLTGRTEARTVYAGSLLAWEARRRGTRSWCCSRTGGRRQSRPARWPRLGTEARAAARPM